MNRLNTLSGDLRGNGLKCEEKDFNEGTEFNRKPMKPPQDGWDGTDV